MKVLRKSQVKNFIKVNEVFIVEECGCCSTTINYSISRGRVIEQSFFTFEGSMKFNTSVVARIRK